MKSKKYRIEFSSTEELKDLAFKLEAQVVSKREEVLLRLNDMGVVGIYISSDGWRYTNLGSSSNEDVLAILNSVDDVLSSYVIQQEEIEVQKYGFKKKKQGLLII